MKDKKLYIFAGPCSIDNTNITDIYKINDVLKQYKNIERGTRIVGLKSRTSLVTSGVGMGIDYSILIKNNQILQNGGTIYDLKIPPSVKIAKQIIEDTDLLVSSEIMMPMIQLPPMVKLLPKKKVMLWNPSVNQLGWQLLQISNLIKNKDWFIGIKNGKWIGAKTSNFDDIITPIEKTWQGLISYTQTSKNKLFLIHRGFETEDKGQFRAKPIHELAKRMKNRTKIKILFDPSHSFGPNMREEIVQRTIETMQFKLEDNTYLYDGLLIEVGHSTTDSLQHISIDEFRQLVDQIMAFRY